MAQRFLQTVFLPIFLVGGVSLAMVVGPMEVVQARQVQSWPTVNGTVAGATIAESLNRKGRRYRPVVRYRYEVDGRWYESDAAFGRGARSFADRAEAEGRLEELLSVGEPLVHFNPDDPHQAALTPNSLVRAWSITGAGALLLAFCGWILVRRRSAASR